MYVCGLMKTKSLVRSLSLIVLIIVKCIRADGQSTANLKQHISFLASDSLHGRMTGSLDERKAADYIISEFKKAGITNEKGNFNRTTTLSNLVFESENSFSVYPNPFDSSFQILNNDQSTRIILVRLYDLSGKMIWEQKSDLQPIMAINPASIQSGFYIGKIIFDNEKSGSFMIIKK